MHLRGGRSLPPTIMITHCRHIHSIPNQIVEKKQLNRLTYVCFFQSLTKVIKELLQGLTPDQRVTYLHMANRDGVTPLHISGRQRQCHKRIITGIIR